MSGDYVFTLWTSCPMIRPTNLPTLGLSHLGPYRPCRNSRDPVRASLQGGFLLPWWSVWDVPSPSPVPEIWPRRVVTSTTTNKVVWILELVEWGKETRCQKGRYSTPIVGCSILLGFYSVRIFGLFRIENSWGEMSLLWLRVGLQFSFEVCSSWTTSN